MCANSLYCGGPKTLLTDQHLLRTNFCFVTETSELRLAGLQYTHLFLKCLRCMVFIGATQNIRIPHERPSLLYDHTNVDDGGRIRGVLLY